jgi:hypothetical protein
MEQQRTEIYHPDYSIEHKDNVDLLPPAPATYGLFAIIDDQPVNCRYVGSAENLRAAVRRHFEQEPDLGLRTFMQGPWIKLILYQTANQHSGEATEVENWKRRYQPSCKPDGEYE